MNFKEALIAHLQGERVEVYTQFPTYDKPQDGLHKWRDFGVFYKSFELGDTNDYTEGSGAEYRLTPRTIMCNGVEVKAGEKEVLGYGASYYLADPDALEFWIEYSWTDHDVNKAHLQRGLVYLNKEDAIARAKAMLITN